MSFLSRVTSECLKALKDLLPHLERDTEVFPDIAVIYCRNNININTTILRSLLEIMKAAKALPWVENNNWYN